MIKFIYFFPEITEYDNVGNKVISQCRCLLNHNIDVILCINSKQEINLNFERTYQFNINVNIKSFWSRYTYFLKSILHLNRIINKSDGSTIIYMRYLPPYFLLHIPLFLKKRKCKLVVEHQTIELNEYCGNINRLTEILLGQLLRKNVDAIVGVTNEITAHQLSRIKYKYKPHITIGNGIDVNSVKLRTFNQYSKKEVHLLCMAKVSRWHGLDRLIFGIANYRGNEKIVLHIAGEGTEIDNLKSIVKTLKISNFVFFHGFLSGNNLNILFDKCHIAIGSLGIHRIGLNEASILKAREYCSRGIPFITAFRDPDFTDDFPYIYRFQSDDSPIDISKIVKFAEKMNLDTEHPNKMREYALNNLDWTIKMKHLKNFLELIVEK